MWILELYTEAVSSKDLTRAAGIASVMTSNAKMVAREIWIHWVSDDCPF